MKLTPIDWSISNYDASEDHAPRPTGCHVSAIIHKIETQQGRLRGRTDVDDDSQDKWKDYRTAGFLVERVFRELLTDLPIVRPGAFCVDGIWMTPDYIDERDWVVEEWKCTWRSSAHEIDGPEFMAWHLQIMAYCYAVGTTRARLRVFFINGDYRPRKPQFKAWEMEFTQEELNDNWRMLINWGKTEGLL